jgi:hypothetical protein
VFFECNIICIVIGSSRDRTFGFLKWGRIFSEITCSIHECRYQLQVRRFRTILSSWGSVGT